MGIGYRFAVKSYGYFFCFTQPSFFAIIHYGMCVYLLFSIVNDWLGEISESIGNCLQSDHTPLRLCVALLFQSWEHF